MIRRLKITLLVVLCSLAGAAAYIVWPRTVPFSECSELYQRYADNEHVAASFVRNYRVNDTLTLDVTLLQATDSAGWQQLIEDFEIPAESIESAAKSVAAGRNLLTILGNKVTDTQIPVASYRDKYICTFHTRDKEQKEKVKMAIFRLIFNSVKANQQLTQNEENN